MFSPGAACEQHQHPRHVTAAALNDDVLRRVFIFLPIGDRKCARLVCKRWHNVSMAAALRRQETTLVDVFQSGYLTSVESSSVSEIYTHRMQSLVEHCSKIPIYDLTLSYYEASFDTEIESQFFESQAANLQSILVKFNRLTPSKLTTLLGQCPNLQSLSLYLGAFSFKDDPFGMRLPMLTSLSLWYVEQLTDVDLQLFAAAAVNLREFCLKFYLSADVVKETEKRWPLSDKGITFQGVLSFVQQCSATLKSLRVKCKRDGPDFDLLHFAELLRTPGLRLETVYVPRYSHDTVRTAAEYLRAVDAQKDSLCHVHKVTLLRMTFASVLEHFASYPHLQSVQFYTMPKWYAEPSSSNLDRSSLARLGISQMLKCVMTLSTDADLVGSGCHTGDCRCRITKTIAHPWLIDVVDRVVTTADGDNAHRKRTTAHSASAGDTDGKRMANENSVANSAAGGSAAANSAATNSIAANLIAAISATVNSAAGGDNVRRSVAAICRFQALQMAQLTLESNGNLRQFVSLPFRSLRHLTTLDVHYSGKSFTDECMQSVCRYLTGLQHLRVDCLNFTDAALTGGITSSDTALAGGVTSSNAALASVTSSDAALIGGVTSSNAALAGITSSDAALTGATSSGCPISNLKGLISLDLKNMSNITDVGLAALRIPHLRRLNLTRFTYCGKVAEVDDEEEDEMESAAQGFTDARFLFPGGQISPSLEALCIQGLGRLTDAGVAGIARLHPRLRHLWIEDVDDMSAVTDASLRAIAEHCRFLVSLNIPTLHKTAITEHGIELYNSQ